MVRTGSKKQPKKEVDKTQYCIDGVLIDEVLDYLPKKGLKIIGAQIVVAMYEPRTRQPISNKMKRLGVTTISSRNKDVTAMVTFDETTPATIKRNVRLIAADLGAKYDKAYFKYLTVENGVTAGKFERTKKDITPTDGDLRKKITVLGLVDATGDVKSLIKSVSADAYVCNIQTVDARIMTCNKQ